MKSTDALTPGSAENGARGFPAVITASLNLTGIYHGVCRGYKAVHQAEYLREWPRLLQMRTQRDWLLRLTPAFMLPAFDKFMAELADLEAYMADMTEVKWADDAPEPRHNGRQESGARHHIGRQRVHGHRAVHVPDRRGVLHRRPARGRHHVVAHELDRGRRHERADLLGQPADGELEQREQRQQVARAARRCSRSPAPAPPRGSASCWALARARRKTTRPGRCTRPGCSRAVIRRWSTRTR
jgi:hypothetical protein